jgi:hypothetical protein
MALADVIAAVNPLLPAGTSVATGAEHLADAVAAPRVVWVPTTEGAGPIVQHWAGEPRALYTRRVGVDLHLWGGDLAATEALVASVVRAVRAAVGASYEVGAGTWPSQDAASVASRGRECVLQITFLVPVTDAPLTTGTVTSTTHDVAFTH